MLPLNQAVSEFVGRKAGDEGWIALQIWPIPSLCTGEVTRLKHLLLLAPNLLSSRIRVAFDEIAKRVRPNSRGEGGLGERSKRCFSRVTSPVQRDGIGQICKVIHPSSSALLPTNSETA